MMAGRSSFSEKSAAFAAALMPNRTAGRKTAAAPRASAGACGKERVLLMDLDWEKRCRIGHPFVCRLLTGVRTQNNGILSMVEMLTYIQSRAAGDGCYRLQRAF